MLSNALVPVYAFYELGSAERCVYVDLALDRMTWKSIRDDVVYTVDDDGTIFDYPHDTIDIKNKYGGRYDLETLKTEGYETLVLEISLVLWEEDDGYQHICIYDDTTETTWLAGLTLDHNYDGKHTYIFYVELALADIKDNDVVIRYDASGAWGDTWKNSNLKFQAGFSKDRRKTASMWLLEPITGGYNCTEYTEYKP